MNEIHHFTSEEPPASSQQEPSGAAVDSRLVWFPDPSSMHYRYTPEIHDMPEDCKRALHYESVRTAHDAAVYDYLCAVHGDVNAVLPRNLPRLPPYSYTLGSSGAAQCRVIPKCEFTEIDWLGEFMTENCTLTRSV